MDQELVVVARCTNRAEAEIIKGALEGDGIRAVIFADDCGGVRPELQLTSGVRILVAAPDAPRAREVLEHADFGIGDEEG